MAELLEKKIKQLDRQIGRTQSAEEKLLESIPGIGPLFSSVIATEIDGITRFNSAAKLAAYAGVVPTTHASGGRVFNGRLLWQCNKWLRWALVEASWSAIQFSSYFGGIYRNARARGKNKNVAITVVAHRMAKIIWQHVFGPRCRCSIRTISRCFRVHHEAAASDVETHDTIRPRALPATRLPMVPRSREPRAIFEPASRRLPDELIQSSANHTHPLKICPRNPTSRG